ncbi:MAG: hypothetical protein R3272_13915, partial [Candidatus Promineifilaceae bacterium]|nr:hypothetical protein [Candidatus Promineifilaceae bacterium]
MNSNKRILSIVAVVLLLLGALGVGLLLADTPVRAFAQDLTDAEEDEREGEDEPITGEALERASAAALDYVGEGEVTDSEVGDEEGFYEVEITLDNGQEVDVHLDEQFNILGREDEVEDEDEDEAEGEDTPITDEAALAAASAAALDYVGEGEVTDTEVGDEEG